jgi:hypothetical protein
VAGFSHAASGRFTTVIRIEFLSYRTEFSPRNILNVRLLVVVMHLPFPFPSCVPVHHLAVAGFPVAGGRRRSNHRGGRGIWRTNIRESAFQVAVFVASFGSPVLRVVTNPKPAALRMQPNNRDGGGIGRRVGPNATATLGANQFNLCQGAVRF